MKYLVIITLLLLHAPIFGQISNSNLSASNDRGLSNAATYRVVDYSYQLQLKESVLNQLVGSFRNAPASSRQIIKEDLEKTLYDLFDLGLTKKETEADHLSKQLAKMESDANYQNKLEEIQQLKMALRKVESSLESRRYNRDRIVGKRLNELTR